MALTLYTNSGWSGFWQMTGDMQLYAAIPRARQGGRSPLERHIAKTFKRNQLRELVAVMAALNGAAAGGLASASYKRVQAPTGPSQSTPAVTEIDEFGGLRTIETVTVINRVTTSADESYVDDVLAVTDNLLSAGLGQATYPTVLGSGGGGMLINGVPSFGG